MGRNGKEMGGGIKAVVVERGGEEDEIKTAEL